MIATNNGGYPWKETVPGEALKKGREQHARGEISSEDLRGLQDRVTRQAIDAQVDAGLDMVTDGLVRRVDPVDHVVPHLEGVSLGASCDRFPGSGVSYRKPVVTAEVSWTAPILVEDFLFAAGGAARATKVVLAGPYTLAKLTEDRAYGDPMSVATAFAAALNQELRALQAAGATFIQIDEPALLQHKDEFPLFTRIWEVLGRGISATLGLHLEGGSIDGIYPGVTRLKRIGCLSLDCIAAPHNLDLLRSTPPPPELRIGLGLIDGRVTPIPSPEAIIETIAGGSGLPAGDRLLLGTASDLGEIPLGQAEATLRALAGAARALERQAPASTPGT